MGEIAVKALVLHGAKDLRLVCLIGYFRLTYPRLIQNIQQDRHIAPPSSNELQIAITASGLCGSDLHYYNHGRNGSFVVRHPFCLGHESIGRVVAVGSTATDKDGANGQFAVGDRVALEVGLPCGSCALCRQGRYNICPTLRFRSSAKTHPHLDGTLMTLTNHPASLCHKLPDTISDIEGALLEPLAVCLHAIDRSNPPSVHDVQTALEASPPRPAAALVFGAGAVGLLLASALASTQHFSTIAVVDIVPARLEAAKKLPFSQIKPMLLPVPSTPPADEDAAAQSTAASILAAFKLNESNNSGFVRSYDCTGAAPCVRAAIHATSAGGRLTLVGMGGQQCPSIPLAAAAVREVDLVGVFRYDGRSYPAAINVMSGGGTGDSKFRDVADAIVSHTVQLNESDAVRGFELAANGVDDQGKPVVKVVVLGSQ